MPQKTGACVSCLCLCECACLRVCVCVHLLVHVYMCMQQARVYTKRQKCTVFTPSLVPYVSVSLLGTDGRIRTKYTTRIYTHRSWAKYAFEWESMQGP